MPRKNKLLAVGDKAPEFTLTDAASGLQVSLDDLLDGPLLIVFGRGTW